MIGDKLIVSAAHGTQVSSYAESIVHSDSFLVQIFIKNFLDVVLRASLDLSENNITDYINEIIVQLSNRISIFRSNQGNGSVNPSLLRKLEDCGSILISKLNSLKQRDAASIRLVVSHGDLNPENVFVDPQDETVFLIDPRDSKYRDVAYDLNTFLGYFFVFCRVTHISRTPTGLQIINPIGYEINLVIGFLLSQLT